MLSPVHIPIFPSRADDFTPRVVLKVSRADILHRSLLNTQPTVPGHENFLLHQCMDGASLGVSDIRILTSDCSQILVGCLHIFSPSAIHHTTRNVAGTTNFRYSHLRCWSHFSWLCDDVLGSPSLMFSTCSPCIATIIRITYYYDSGSRADLTCMMSLSHHW